MVQHNGGMRLIHWNPEESDKVNVEIIQNGRTGFEWTRMPLISGSLL